MDRLLEEEHHGSHERVGGFYRRTPRNPVTGFSCDIAEGNRLHGGVVEDISRHGFKLRQIGQWFQGNEHYYRAVLSGDGHHFKLIAKPCWRKQTAEGLEVGFKILDASWEWLELILLFEQTGEGSWAAGNG